MKENKITVRVTTAKKQQEKDKKEEQLKIRHVSAAFASLPRVLGLVWATDKRLTFAMAFISVARGFIPAISVFITKQLIDSVVRAIFTHVTTLVWILVAVQLAVNLLNTLMPTLTNIVQQLLQPTPSHLVQSLLPPT